MQAVSDWPCGMIGHILFRSGPIRSDSIDRRRAYIQLTLPRTVLISPLWARNRYGCASFQDGKVLVEKRWCTSASAEVVSVISQVVVETADLGRQQQPLVDHRPGREGRHIGFA